MKTKGRSIWIALMILMMISAQALAQNTGNGNNSDNGSQVMAQNMATRGAGNGGNGETGNSPGVYGTDGGGFGNGESKNVMIRERERERARLRFQTQILSEAVPVEIKGVVFEVLYSGSALVIATDTEDPENPTTTLYGLGPQWYWDILNVSKPDVGEELFVEALIITLSDGSERVIATTITILGDGLGIADIVVPLRDEYGRPLWRQIGYGLD